MSARWILRRAAGGAAIGGVALATTVIAASGASAASSSSVHAAGSPPAPATSTATTTATPTVTQPAVAPVVGVRAGNPPDPALAAKVAGWVGHGGELGLMTLVRDFGALEQSAASADMSRMGTSCAQLGTDVTAAQTYAPIPDRQAQAQWAAALTSYAHGSSDCVTGTRTSNTTLIMRAATEIVAGSKNLDQVTARLNVIAGR